MITFKLGRHIYNAATRWSDLTPEDAGKFISLCTVLEAFETGAVDFNAFRIGIASALLGIDFTRLHDNDITAENLCRLAEYTTFPYSLTENEDGSRTACVNVILSRNLLPDAGDAPGYRFYISPEGLVDCDITAEQYVDAVEVMELYASTRKDEVLDRLFSILYPKATAGVRRETKIAVFYNFRGILEWIKLLPDNKILFAGKIRKGSGANPLGLSSSIFSLSKSGYGTLQEMKNLDLFSYLGALVQQNIDGILSLRSAGLKPVEIADRMHLPLDCVLPYITDNSE